MKTYTFEISGRKYQLETSLAPEQLKIMEARIREETARMGIKYPKADRLDVTMVCLIELWERFFALEKRLIEKESSIRAATVRLQKLAAGLNRKISELTG